MLNRKILWTPLIALIAIEVGSAPPTEALICTYAAYWLAERARNALEVRAVAERIDQRRAQGPQ